MQNLPNVKTLYEPIGKLFYFDFVYLNELKETKDSNRIYSELDPYGEEDWDN